MRFHPFVLLASAAVLTGVTVSVGVSGTSKGEGNSAASVPPFFPDSDDDSRNVPLIGQNAAKDEARTYPGPSRVIPELLKVVQKEKPLESKLFEISGKQQIAPGVLNRMGDSQNAAGMSADRAQAARGVWNGMIAESKTQLEASHWLAEVRPELRVLKSDTPEVRAYVNYIASRANQIPNVNSPITKDNIVKWIQKQPEAKELHTVLIKNNFIWRLDFKKMEALKDFFDGDETKTIRTLLKSCKSATKFTDFLSIAKLSPAIRNDAVSFQQMLLRYWSTSQNEQISYVIELLQIKTRGLTYETMDTLVEFVALKEEIKGDQLFALKRTLWHLDTYFGVDNYFESNIAKGKDTNGQANAHPGTSHQDGRSGVPSIASEEHNEPSILLRTESVVKRKAENLDSGRVRKKPSPLTNDVPEDDPGLSLVLSLRPPGT
uniref:RxLR effector candidate protein n=2 Tax=Peronospora matthiolae TaxID=2874970 RepID=A0AAV1U8A3_9STRA